MKKRVTIFLFRGFCAGIGLIVAELSTSGCSGGCPYTSQEYVTMTNTLSAPATVVFRRYFTQTEFTETIVAGETRTIELGNYERKTSSATGEIKALCDLGVVRDSVPVQYSNTTLAQYMICDGAAVGVNIMALTDTCNGNPVLGGY